MFGELFQLAVGATLTLTVSADEGTGKLTINVIPKPKEDHGESALSTPLTLTATPAEFDSDFVQALRGYRAEHRSLAEQAEATKDLLQAAKAASQSKARGAVAKASTKPTSKATTAGEVTGGDVDDEEDAEKGGEGGDTSKAAPASSQPSADVPPLFG
jgi:PRTRC genetic system protein E